MNARSESPSAPLPAAGPGAPPASGTPARPPLLRELLLVAVLFLLYKGGRRLATGHREAALRNGHDVWELERLLRLPGEGAVQSLLLHGEGLVRLANTYYAAVHFPATLAFLVWLYLRRPVHYRWARRVLAAVTAAALVLHLAFPLAPPRMLAATGLVDTARVYGPSVYGPPETDTLSNQFAAMPSLHFGWALMVAIGLAVATRSRWRSLWLLHPLLTLLVIVGTANHFWLDAIVAAALLGTALATLRLPRSACRPRGAPTVPGRSDAAGETGKTAGTGTVGPGTGEAGVGEAGTGEAGTGGTGAGGERLVGTRR
ncbi:phosphatase PAP2 family protein [Streptomyces prasinopilosus]|uniref:PAP2 superfamily protein n=1 Tax=Streptomyces prasinopilosus TaxID=67344 RepID=A0A1G6MLP8_9ACTN|nr:phosphatase PAP2 family protein [Streptomyces prasinopilosus]SDC56429.1 PAP2 superfamily protein [Streptomyces prasinopilosus]